MQILKNKRKVEAFCKALDDPSQKRLILLDYDGTLAPFKKERLSAIPYKGIRDLLDSILENSKNKIVLISGRNAKEVKELIALRHPVEIWGGHGMERLLENGKLIKAPISEGSEQVFSLVKDWARREGFSKRIEAKHGSLAFHVRGLEKKEASRLMDEARDFFQDVIPESGLEIDDFDGGVELRTIGVNKGKVVNIILSEHGEEGLISYFGDDFTDEDAFLALNDRGVSFLVRKELRDTNADVWLIPPEELKECLGKFIIK